MSLQDRDFPVLWDHRHILRPSLAKMLGAQDCTGLREKSHSGAGCFPRHLTVSGPSSSLPCICQLRTAAERHVATGPRVPFRQVLSNVDELFERHELSAAPDPGWPDCFNSGVFVFQPSLETHSLLLRHATEHGSFDGRWRNPPNISCVRRRSDPPLPIVQKRLANLSPRGQVAPSLATSVGNI